MSCVSAMAVAMAMVSRREQAQLHAGQALRDAVTHGRHAAGHLGRGATRTRLLPDQLRPGLVGLVRRQHVVVGRDDAQVAAPSRPRCGTCPPAARPRRHAPRWRSPCARGLAGAHQPVDAAVPGRRCAVACAALGDTAGDLGRRTGCSAGGLAGLDVTMALDYSVEAELQRQAAGGHEQMWLCHYSPHTPAGGGRQSAGTGGYADNPDGVMRCFRSHDREPIAPSPGGARPRRRRCTNCASAMAATSPRTLDLRLRLADLAPRVRRRRAPQRRWCMAGTARLRMRSRVNRGTPQQPGLGVRAAARRRLPRPGVPAECPRVPTTRLERLWAREHAHRCLRRAPAALPARRRAWCRPWPSRSAGAANGLPAAPARPRDAAHPAPRPRALRHHDGLPGPAPPACLARTRPGATARSKALDGAGPAATGWTADRRLLPPASARRLATAPLAHCSEVGLAVSTSCSHAGVVGRPGRAPGSAAAHAARRRRR